MKRMASARKRSSSNGRSRTRHSGDAARPQRQSGSNRPRSLGHFAVCVCNDDYPASLDRRKLYAVLDDDFAERHGLIRVIDESGEAYLYPESYFVRIALPKPIEKTLRRIA